MDTSGDATNTEKTFPSQRPALDVGMTLRKAREGLGLSVHDIANRIKFSPRQVEALEANDFENLPRTTFLRGFVRSYARVLQLDEAALIAALPCDPVAPVVTRTKSLDVAFPSLLSMQRVNLLWLAGAVGVALLLGLFVFTGSEGNLVRMAKVVVEPVSLPASDAVATDVPVSAVQDATAEESTGTPNEQSRISENKTEPLEKRNKTPETSMPVAQVKIQTKPQTEIPEKKKDAAPSPVSSLSRLLQSTASSSDTQIAPASAPVAETEAGIKPKPEIPLEILKLRPIHFIFDEASWAKVVDAHGNLLLSRYVPRGGEKWVGGPGREPYDVSIKSPSKVRLYYKGKQIDLSPYAEMEMAHLTVE